MRFRDRAQAIPSSRGGLGYALLLLTIGAALGVAATRASRQGPVRATTEAVTAKATRQLVEPRAAHATTPSIESTITAELKRRLSEHSTHSTESDHVPSDDPQVSEPSAAERIGKVQAEPRNDDWAVPTAAILDDELSAVAKRLDFQVGKIDCRTQRCTAELGWPSLAEAQADFKAVLSSESKLGCRRRLLLPESEQRGVTGVLVVDCAEERATQLARAADPPAKQTR